MLDNQNPVLMPLRPKQIVRELMHKYRLNTKQLAKILGVAPRTIVRMRTGRPVNDNLNAMLITFYCTLSLKERREQAQKKGDE